MFLKKFVDFVVGPSLHTNIHGKLFGMAAFKVRARKDHINLNFKEHFGACVVVFGGNDGRNSALWRSFRPSNVPLSVRLCLGTLGLKC